jgi:stearoyl-CoA desaturase (delta-9 desaturase)
MTAVVEEGARRPDLAEEPPSVGMKITIAIFVLVPLLAVGLAIPVAWGGWLSWTDVIIAAVFYAISALGITVGFHRYFTHGSFKAPRAVKILLAVAGSMAIQGSLAQWVADHRRHHANSDEEADPHSPWKYGTSPWAVTKGLVWAHMGWLMADDQSAVPRWAPDIAGDKDLQKVTRLFPLIVLASIVLPAVIGGLVTWSWQGALTALFWAGLVRIALVHHVTWSINSICHVFGKHPFVARDRSGNVAWLALPSFGESWHNLHHADPTCARHGVLKGQVDVSAALIRALEKSRLAYDVRWPKPARLAAKVTDPAVRARIRGWSPES